MPKFGAHILIAELAREKQPEAFAGPINALRLGAVGPDLTLFLFDPFFKDRTVRDGFNTAVQVLEAIGEIKDKLKKLEEDFEKATQPANDLIDWFTGGLVNDSKEVLEYALEAMLLCVKLSLATTASTGINVQNPLASLIEDLSKVRDPKDIEKLIKDPRFRDPFFWIGAADNVGFPFRNFGHPLTDDGNWHRPEPEGNYSNWWWMDMLHYRRTGAFAEALRAHATTPATQAYATGYITHVAGDICGHPFINGIVGGPFRNHAYRHMVLEGLADTWLWHHHKRKDIVSSRLDEMVQVEGSELREICEQIVQAMKATYTPPMRPNLFKGGYPKVEDLESAAFLMGKYLKLSTSGTIEFPRMPPDSPDEVFDEIRELLKRNDPGNPPSSSGNPIDYLVALLGWLMKGMATLIMLATLPHALLARLTTVPARWVLYLVKLAIYQIICALRTMLALMGYGYSSYDDFKSFGFLKDWIRARGEGDSNTYPFGQTERPKKPMYWLADPQDAGAVVEQPWTLTGLRQGGKLPDHITNPANIMDAANAHLLAELNAAASPARTVEIELALRSAGSVGFGNAVDFSIDLVTKKWPMPDLDLDGDRGYGFRSWDGLPPNSHYEV